MKYDCEFIQDVVSLYKENVLSDKSKKIVTEHLEECPICKHYYESFPMVSAQSEPNREAAEVNALSDFAEKIRKYHFYQICMFVLSILSLSTIVLPWFGIQGITEIGGTILLSYPLAIIGLALFQYAIWFNFKSCAKRRICGYIGLGIIFLIEIYIFLTVYNHHTFSVDFLLFSIDMPHLETVNLLNSFSNARFGFYLSCVGTICEAVAFFFFTRKIK